MNKQTKSFIKQIVKAASNEYASVADEGIIGGDVKSYEDTGSYTLNALISGSIFGGVPSNKVLGLAGEPSTGKTFYALSICDNFLKNHENGVIVYFESEGAVSKEMLEQRGIDASRFLIFPVATIEDFRSQARKIINDYKETSEEDRIPMMFVLDSLGALSTEKETTDISEGKNVRDMTKAQLVKGTFRVLTLSLAILNIPMLVTNHVYDVIGATWGGPPKKMGGGYGLEYAASIVVYLSKKKGKIGDDVVGATITAKLGKSRLTVEGRKVETLLRYDTGLDPYWGLFELSKGFNLLTKDGQQWKFSTNGVTAREKEILSNPEKYFTEDVLKDIEKSVPGEFKYGNTAVFFDPDDTGSGETYVPDNKNDETPIDFKSLKKKQKKTDDDMVEET